jgi:hypothetical protein
VTTVTNEKEGFVLKSDDKQKIKKKKKNDVCREFDLLNLDQTNLEEQNTNISVF